MQDANLAQNHWVDEIQQSVRVYTLSCYPGEPIDANETWVCLIKLSTLYSYSPHCSLYISEDTVREDLLDDPRLLWLGMSDHLVYSHNFDVCLGDGIVRRSQMIINPRQQVFRQTSASSLSYLGLKIRKLHHNT